MGYTQYRRTRHYPIIPYTRFRDVESIPWVWGPDYYGVRILDSTVMHKTYPQKEEPACGSTCPVQIMSSEEDPRPPPATSIRYLLRYEARLILIKSESCIDERGGGLFNLFVMHVELHIKTKSGKGKVYKNTASIILTYHKDSTDSYIYTKSLKHRSVDKLDLARRDCDEEEYKECAHPYRLSFIHYKNWDTLLNDEKKFNPPQDWIDTLNKLKLEYPQFNAAYEKSNSRNNPSPATAGETPDSYPPDR